MSEEQIIEKIQKLLRLGKSANEHEAALAAAAAQRLMAKYKISQAMLFEGNAEEEKINDDKLWSGKKSRSQWRIRLAIYVAAANSCKTYTSGPNIHIVGHESNRQTAQYIFKFCESEIERLSKKYAGQGKGWINNYKIGACDAIRDKLNQATDAARYESVAEFGVKASTAIAVLDKQTAIVGRWMEQKMKLVPGKGFGKQSNHQDARSIGYKDGQQINLNSGKAIGPGNLKLKE